MLATQDGFHADDKSQVEKDCGQTPHPDVCVSCVNSDPNRSTSEILFCMMSEATHGHEVADPQVRNTREPNLKQALQTCNVSIFSASNDLTDSFMRMEGEDYQKTETDLESANEDALQRHKAFLKLYITQEGDYDVLLTIIQELLGI
ncbi:hypothetical protein VitviT2T_020985 [Vitis vinifera]|uniref:Uncharacterized protein n=1 Tax=Vitis vinifera TaxID=29760 RepID=A0ABY9D643_VITVI|nr:hypothetical protein VitviT2T_020985 [Vitis vinifera]